MGKSFLKLTFLAASTIVFSQPSLGQSTGLTGKTVISSSDSVHTVQFSENLQALESDAQAFIDTLSRQVLAFHEDTSLTHHEKTQAFAGLLETNFDMSTISRFVLGRYWRTATPAQRGEYQRLFRDYIVNIYTKRFEEFNDYDVENILIQNARKINGKDYVVNTVISFADQPDVGVEWRIRNKNGTYQIIDVMIEGISMSVTQRSDFSSVIQRGGGNVEVLLRYLRNKT